VIETGALRALVLAACGDAGAAVDALARALALGCPQGYVRVFADQGAPMAALLARLAAAQKAERAAARGVPPGCLAKVLRAFGGKDNRQGAAVTVPGLVEQLTAREMEVLVLLAAGMPNPRIAEQLVVTSGHGEKARQPPAGQARRGQPHRGRHPGPPAQPDPLAAPSADPRRHRRAPRRTRRHCRASGGAPKIPPACHLRVTPARGTGS
jgi:hypothetical protein